MLSNGSKFGHYQISEMIGRGAMGVVYRALDTANNREIALKVINEKHSHLPEYAARLNDEARRASRVNSPHVVKIWEHGQIDGVQFMAMEYVSGTFFAEFTSKCSFRAKVDLVIQIAEGLKSAHSLGLIHRDLKPDNIKVNSEGVVKILDFGLAKEVHADSVDEFGNIEGTLYYIAPEQLTGGSIAQNSDLFSLGVVMYEIFTGHRPFEGEYPAAILYSILHESPILPSEINKDLPAWVDGVIIKLLSKQPSERFQYVDELVAALKKCLLGEGGCQDAHELLPPQTVTVVDLKNLTGDADWEHLCIGLTEELIKELSRRTDLIISAEPSTTYSRNIGELFEKCRSDFVIAGTLLSWRDKMRLHLKVYSENGKKSLMSKDYEADTQSIFTILSNIAGEIASILAEITGSGSQKITDYFQTDITAYDYYLKGRNYYQTNKPDDLLIAEKMFKKALEVDDSLAYAHAGLSDLYAFQYMAYYDHRAAKIENARTEALRAIEISPQLPEAHRSLGRFYMFIGDYDNAEKSFLKAVQINPKYAVGYRTLAWLKEIAGDYEKAIYWSNLSLKYAPNDLETLLLLSLINMDSRKFTLAMATLHRALELAPDYGRAYYNLGTVYLKLGVLELALENFLLAAKYKGDPNALVDVGYLCMIMKNYDSARRAFEESIAQGYFPFIAGYLLGFMERSLGNRKESEVILKNAVDLANKAASEDKDNLHIKAYLAMSYAALGQREQFIATLQEIDTNSISDGNVLYYLARAYAVAGDKTKAREFIERSILAHAGPSEKEVSLDPHFTGIVTVSEESAA